MFPPEAVRPSKGAGFFCRMPRMVRASLSHLVNQSYALIPAEFELRWPSAPPPARNLITLSSPAAKRT